MESIAPGELLTTGNSDPSVVTMNGYLPEQTVLTQAVLLNTDGGGIMFLDPSQLAMLPDGTTVFDGGGGNYFTIPSAPATIEPAEILITRVESVTAPPPSSPVPEPSNALPAPPLPAALMDDEILPPSRQGPPFKCLHCPKEFGTAAQLRKHQWKQHAEEKPYQCENCSQSFNVEANLRLHQAIHSPDLTCPDCHKIFSRLASLKAHLMLHEQEENLECNICGEELRTHFHLNLHMKEHQNSATAKVPEPREKARNHFKCSKCNKKLTSYSLLREHLKFHNKIKASLSRRSHRKHILRDHFQHKCNVCTKSFLKPSQLDRHSRIHTGERPYKCDKCSKAFNQKGALRIHLVKHTGARPFPCEFCPAAFSQRGNLRSHIQRVHNVAEDPSHPFFKCSSCSCVFRKLGSLSSHVSRMHGDIPLDMYPDKKTLEAIKKPDTGAPAAKQADILQQALQNSGLPHDSKTPELPPQVDSNVKVDGIVEEEEAINEEALQVADKENIALVNHSITSLPKVTPALGTDPLQTDVALLPSSHDAPPPNMKSPIQSIVDAITDQVVASQNNFVTQESGHLNEEILHESDTDSCDEDNGVNISKYLLKSSSFVTPVTDHVTGTVINHITRRVGKVKWHQCIYCSKEFKKPSDLVRHIRTHTHEKPFKCDQCYSAFAVKSTLTSHLRTHKGLKEFECSVCQKKFATQGSREVHMRIHTNTKPFSCDQCGKKFRTTGHRQSHIITHQKDATVIKKKTTLLEDKKAEQKPQSGLAIPLQEPIYITDEGIIQLPSKPITVSETGEVVVGEGPFKCGVCQRAFKKSTLLKQHARSHSGNKPFKCNECQHSFVSNGILKAHKIIHRGIRNFNCKKCNASFMTNGSLKRHQSMHSDLRPYMCPYCQKTFKSKNSCKTHMRTHRLETTVGTENITTGEEPQVEPTYLTLETSEVLGPFDTQTTAQPTTILQAIPAQAETFETQATEIPQATAGEETTSFFSSTFATAPQTHFSLQAEGLDSTFIIPETIVTTNISNILHQDVIPEEDTTKKSFPCHFCGKIFKKSSHLKQHVRKHTGERPFQCSQCMRMFASKGVLRTHIKTHTGVREFCCPTCGSHFTTKGSLTRHLAVHSEVRPHICSSCQEAFRTPSSLKKHEKIHQQEQISLEGDGESSVSKAKRPIVKLTEEEAAELAQKDPDQVPNSLSMRVLIASAAEINRVSELKENAAVDDGAYPNRCLHCPKTFKKPSDLVRHTRTHTGERPYICEICHKRFTVKSTLDSHRNTHTGNKNFSCHVCASSFATKGSLKVHMRLHTGAKPFKCPHCNMKFRTSGHRKSHMASSHQKEEQQHAAQTQQPQTQEEEAVDPTGTTTYQLQLPLGLDLQGLTIDASLLEQLQAQGNLNITIMNPSRGLVIEHALEDGQLITLAPAECPPSPSSTAVVEEPIKEGRNHVCQLCNRSFKRLSHLRDHMNTHQASAGESQELSSLRRPPRPLAHTCTHCGKLFEKPSQLERHLRIHTGERPFQCPSCPRAFNQKNSLQTHMKRHTGEKPHSCSHCSLSFTQKGNLKVHLKRVHPDEDVEWTPS